MVTDCELKNMLFCYNFFAEPVKHKCHPTAYFFGQLNHLPVKKRSDFMNPVQSSETSWMEAIMTNSNAIIKIAIPRLGLA